MAGFVQIIQFKTSKYDDMQKVIDKFREETAGKCTTTRAMVCRDRDNAGQFMTIVEFPSYEAAMKKRVPRDRRRGGGDAEARRHG